jgi:hypothetical protein
MQRYNFYFGFLGFFSWWCGFFVEWFFLYGLLSFAEVKTLFRLKDVLRLPTLQPTGKRLGAAAAFLHYLSSSHVPPPLRQTAR